MNMQGPVEVELKIYIISHENETAGVATIGMGKGKIPTIEEMKKRIEEFAKEEMPDGFALCNKVEFFNQCVEEMGVRERIACPGGEDWDV